MKYQDGSAYFKNKKNWLRAIVNPEITSLTYERIAPRTNEDFTTLNPSEGGPIQFDHMPEHGKWTNGEAFGRERALNHPSCLEVK